jgi:hypothetical protein
MRKIFTLCLMVLCTEILLAQPVITSDYNPIYGDIYVYKIVDDTSTAQPGQAGAGVVWNLASMHGQLTTRQYNWKQTALTNDAFTFAANSNLAAEIIQNGFSPRYEFYQVGPNFTDDMRKVGTHIDFAITNYAGGYMQFDYPLSYTQSCTDTMLGTTGVAYVNGRSTTTYDGHGTLQLEAQSGGNFSNVARIKVVEDYIVNYGPVETHHAETYYWLDQTTINLTKQPIAIITTHEWVDLNGISQREKFAFMRQILFINGLPAVNFNAENISVSPNPFNDNVVFTIPAIDSEVDIMISDITGQLVKEIHLQKSLVAREESVMLNELRSGVYFAKFSSEKGSVVKKIVKN